MAMMPGETIRYACVVCHIVFDICPSPVDEWAESYPEDESNEPFDLGEPTVCPFCGAGELRAKHDAAIHRPVVRHKPGEIFLN